NYLEIGPAVLRRRGQYCLPGGAGLWVTALRRGRPEWEQILDSLAALSTAGVEVDWQGFDRDYSRRKVVLPTYPCQRKRHWFTRPADASAVWEAVTTAGLRQAEQVPIDLGLHTYAAKWRCLHDLAVGYMTATLHALGVFRQAGDAHTAEDVVRRIGATSTYR